MRFTKHKIIMMLLLATIQSQEHNYFQYDDCPQECTSQIISCSITEITTDSDVDFLRICVTSTMACEQLSSSDDVCLRPNDAPIGGKSIWQRFKNKYHPTVTTTTETPNLPINEESIRFWEGATLISLLMIMLLCIAVGLLYGKHQNNTDTEHIITDIDDIEGASDIA